MMVERFRLSPEQHRLSELSRGVPADLFQTSLVVEVRGNLAATVLRSALASLVERFEILRTTYHRPRGMAVPAQVISEKLDPAWEEYDVSNVLPQEQAEICRRYLEDQAVVDLEHGPILKATYIRRGCESALLRLTVPAMAGDGYSAVLLLRELARECGLVGIDSEGNEEILQYADLAEWRNGLLEGQEVSQAETNLVTYDSEPLHLPYELTTSPTGFQPRMISRELDDALAESLLKTATSLNVSAAALVCGCWQILLWRLSGNGRFLFGAACDGRTYEELLGAAGLFARYVPILTALDGDKTFENVLRELTGQLDDAAARQEYYGWDLSSEFECQGERFLPCVFEYQELPARIGGESAALCLDAALDHGVSPVCSRFDRFRLRLLFQTVGGRLRLSLDYDQSSYEVDAIERQLDQLIELLRAAIASPERSIGSLNICGSSEQKVVLEEFSHSNTQSVTPNDAVIHDLIHRMCTEKPQALAAICGEERLTYEELDIAANRLADRLRCMSVGPNDLVPLLCDRSTSMLVGLYGILKANAAYVPIDPSTPGERIRLILEDVDARAIVTQRHLAVSADRPDLHQIILDEDHPDQPRRTDASEASMRPGGSHFDDFAYMIYTSGSTGRPKGVPIRHRQLVDSTLTRMSWYNKPVGRYLLSSSLAFDSSVAGVFWTLCQGGTLVIPEPGDERDPGSLAALVGRHAVTHILCLPSLYRLMLQAHAEELRSLRTVIVAGDACSAELIAEHRSQLPETELFNEYGPTEATVWSTVFDCLSEEVEGSVPIGRPIPRASVYVLDEFMNPAPIGIPGELYIGGVGVAGQYFQRPELSAEKFVDDPFAAEPGKKLYRSGDLVSYRSDGVLRFHGRIDDQIKIRGYRIEPGEVAVLLEADNSVAKALVIPRGSAAESKQLVAYVQPTEGGVVDTSQLRKTLDAHLPGYMIPSHIIPVSQFPLTVTGKVDRQALPEPDCRRQMNDQEFVAPRNPLEREIASIWSELLKVDRIGIHDDFFASGGDSIQAAIFINKLKLRLGEVIHVATLFRAPTIAEFATYVQTDYSDAVEAMFGNVTRSNADHHDQPRIDEASVEALQRSVISLEPPPAETTPKNPRAVFVLCSPRSGSTLLRVMLAGNPNLFVPPEIELLNFNTMRERDEAFVGPEQFLGEGFVRALMQVRCCGVGDAQRTVEELVQSNASTKEAFALLQSGIDKRILVDKTACYALDPEILKRAESNFDEPLFIHILRNPCGMIHSFNQVRLDQVFFRYPTTFSTRELAELVWNVSQRNILHFLEAIPQNRQLRITFEDLVNQPEQSMQGLCQFLQIPFDTGMLNPYEPADWKMLDGTSQHSQMQGDPKFHEHSSVDPRVAERWKSEFDSRSLGNVTRDLAQQLGYSVRTDT